MATLHVYGIAGYQVLTYINENKITLFFSSDIDIFR